MARKVTDTTMIADDSYLLSQTPSNYDKDNFYLKELQDKINYEWRFRPNRVNVEYEKTWGQDDYEDLEVVVQTVKSEKGTAYSDDFRHLVFRDIREKRFNIGNKFRFSIDYDADAKDEDKDIWLVTNFASIKPTTSVVVQRCVNTLGSVVLKKDSKEVDYYHYEPVILGTELTSVGLLFNQTVVSAQARIIALVQHNQYTSQYFINQRFVVGYDKVYRVVDINKAYSKQTKDPLNVGLMRVYLELTEESPYDVFGEGFDGERIAYQEDNFVKVDQNPGNEEGYSIRFLSPAVIPEKITANPLLFTAKVYHGDAEVTAPVTFTLSIPKGDVTKYLKVENIDDNSIEVSLLKIYVGGYLTITASATVGSDVVSAKIDNISIIEL